MGTYDSLTLIKIAIILNFITKKISLKKSLYFRPSNPIVIGMQGIKWVRLVAWLFMALASLLNDGLGTNLTSK